jgi:Zn2+/Cd2+-exporting ATPase
VVAYAAGGLPAAWGALQTVLNRKLDIDLLMVLAALAAAGVGEVRDGAILLFLFSLAGTLEGYAMGNTKRAVVALMKLRPETALLRDLDGTLRSVPVAALQIGQQVLVRAGERLPVDGEIAAGVSAVDQSTVTGESVPVDKGPADDVFAGSVNGFGVLTITVTKLASQSTLARMIDLVASAQAERSPSERFSEWFGSRYTIVVLVGSIAALGGFLLFGVPLSLALYKAATLLVVASPCAIVISVPAAVLSALAAAAKRGMLFKGGAALEEFGSVTTIAFDKTGTLTTGEMNVTEVVPFHISETELLTIAAALEATSEHPLAQSIIRFAATKNITPSEVTGTVVVPGKGIHAVSNGVHYWAGNRRMLAHMEKTLSPEQEAAMVALEAKGNTTIVVGTDTAVIGCIGIADTVRETAREAIAALRQIGITRVVMLTGDHISVATAVGAQLGIKPDDIYADLLPEDKVVRIKTLRETGRVAFVGDGVNDAAALATAHVGIAMGTAGTDVALEAADVALLSDDLRKLLKAFALSRQTNRIIKQNLVFAIGILLVMVIVTVFFYLPLPLGVIGHEGGTLLVVLNGLRLLWF